MLNRLMMTFVCILGVSSCFINGITFEEPKSEILIFEKIEKVNTIEEIYPDEMPLQPLGYRKDLSDIPDDIWLAAIICGMEYTIAPEFLCAIAWRETRLQNINSANGLYIGPMQISKAVHGKRASRLGVTNLNDVTQNMRVASDYLRELFDEHEDPAIVLMLYHGEPYENITRYKQTGRTSEYVKSILEYAHELESRGVY